jgi:endonuclease/exonuclease/phosphatase family metal-dependent hydrolase
MTVALATLAVVVVTAVLFVVVTEHRPAPREVAAVVCAGGGPPPAPGRAGRPGLVAGRPFRVVSWNIQYSAGRKHRFFYDGGDAVHVPRQDVEETLQALQAALRALQPQVTLLQEVDRNSDRTHRMDQLPALAGASGVAALCRASATYHRSPFVPHPLPVPLGRVAMDLAILTAGPLLADPPAERIALPLLVESRFRQAFNLKRALLTAAVPVEGWDRPLLLAVTHLSAFSHGDGTLDRQVAVLAEWMAAHPPEQPWILAGDLNLLPPGDDPARLHLEAEHYTAGDGNPLHALIPRFRTATPVAELLGEAHRTYLPHGAAAPDRKIDYVFVGGPVRVDAVRVAVEHGALSDHLPMVVDVRVAPPD